MFSPHLGLVPGREPLYTLRGVHRPEDGCTPAPRTAPQHSQLGADTASDCELTYPAPKATRKAQLLVPRRGSHDREAAQSRPIRHRNGQRQPHGTLPAPQSPQFAAPKALSTEDCSASDDRPQTACGDSRCRTLIAVKDWRKGESGM